MGWDGRGIVGGGDGVGIVKRGGGGERGGVCAMEIL